MNYKIKVGRHYHSNIFSRIISFFRYNISRTKLKARVLFTEDCWYPQTYVANDGYNKLFGGGELLHKQNSARFVWMPNEDDKGVFDIYTYVYEDGNWTAHLLDAFTVGQWYDIEIGIKYSLSKNLSYYVFSIDGYEMEIEHKQPSLSKILHPYFGGKDTAPRTMNIKIK